MRSVAILGYGIVGQGIGERLAARGDRVRIAQRSHPGAMPASAAFTPCDLTDRQAVTAACRAVDTVVLAAGFPYRSALWEQAWPAAMRNTLEASAAAGARLVFADNLYMYGPQTAPLREDMPLTTFGRKPRVRAEITRLWQEAHAAGRVKAAAVRASDFYGPGAATSVLAQFGVKPLVEGKAAMIPYSPDHPHDFTFVGDFARAVVTLIDAPDDAYGEAWHVPNAPTHTLRQLLMRAAALIGASPRIRVMPPVVQSILGLFVADLAELKEMRFQTDRPYIVDASKFAARFWSDATPFDDGLAATIASYR